MTYVQFAHPHSSKVTNNQKRQLTYHRHHTGYAVPFSFDDFSHVSFSFDKMFILIGNVLKKYGKKLDNEVRKGEAKTSVERLHLGLYDRGIYSKNFTDNGTPMMFGGKNI